MSFGSNTDGQARGASTVNALSARAVKYRRRRGGFIIIWGSRSLSSRDSTVAPLYRACPGCRQQSHLIGMVARRWFTFFFCPIFPIGSDQRFVQCSTCGGKFTGVKMPPAGGAMAGPPLVQVAGALPGKQSFPGAAMTPPPAPKSFPWIWVAIGVPLLVVVAVGVLFFAGMVKGLRAARAAAANSRNTTMVNQASPAQGSQWSPPPHPEIQSTADALEAMNSHDIDWGNKGYDWLKRSDVDPANRAAVLKYLRPFLTPNPAEPNEYRNQVDRIELFCKWADSTCTPDLLALLDADFHDVHPAESAFAGLARVAPEVAETELRKRWPNDARPFIPAMLNRWRRSNDPALSAEGVKMEAEFVAWRDDRKKTADAAKHAQDQANAAAKRAKEEADRALTPEHLAEWLESPDSNKHRDAFAGLTKIEIPAAQRERIHKALCAIATSDKTPGFRRDAARYLADFGQPADIALLTAMANEPDAGKLYTSVPAASAMLLDPAAGLKILDAHSSERRYADNVANELARHGEKAEPAGLAMLKSSDPEIRHGALNVLGKVGTKASLANVKAAQAVETDKKLLGHYKSTIKDIEKR